MGRVGVRVRYMADKDFPNYKQFHIQVSYDYGKTWASEHHTNDETEANCIAQKWKKFYKIPTLAIVRSEP